MNLSFYSAAVGASAQQSKLDTIANNMANVNTTGYKAQDASFADLIYTNINDLSNAQNVNLKNGSGTRYEKTDVLFQPGSFVPSEGEFDYAIEGRGFFAVMDPATQQIRYTRDGSFHMSLQDDNEFYLVTGNGDQVLDEEGEPIVLTENGERIPEGDLQKIGVYDFKNTEGMQCVGQNEFVPIDKNGEAEVMEDPKLVKGYLETSNLDLPSEMAKLIETQRIYQMALRMVQTSDEIEQTVNSLR